MKFLPVFLSSFLALSAGSSIYPPDYIPPTPGDNSHYEKGVSRYIWIPDGDGVPHLVDLQVPVDPTSLRSGRNIYNLYTRLNQYSKQELISSDVYSVQNSNYNASLPIVVIVHGWNNDGESNVNHLLRDAFLHVGDYNVIVVDWSKRQSLLYPVSAGVVDEVGENLGLFLEWLLSNFGGDWDKMHIMGHSLGAHVSGNAGRTLGGKVARITAMDPAGPNFGDDTDRTLRNTDGKYVECINTDGHILGIYDPICTNNFYPNGGTNPQPGCLFSTCSHSRSYEYVAASVRYNRFIAFKCLNQDELENNLCNGDTLRMGNTELHKEGSGLYRLNTGSEWPY
ncbi:lipoprotein lipase-like [Pieris napi]|uniref:lipoprotein lipase-like n=1 Tax=Pieris napi TaxID=78633 RepID=UPI001FBA42D6|nr:lipoprotein lipase-like [Pieris napi]